MHAIDQDEEDKDKVFVTIFNDIEGPLLAKGTSRLKV